GGHGGSCCVRHGPGAAEAVPGGRLMAGLARVAILGASGYIGGEALRLLLAHPSVEVVAATSPSHAGRPVTTVHPHLTKLTDLVFSADLSAGELADLDAVFLALPHGGALRRVPEILAAAGSGGPRGEGPSVFDLSGDFRLKDPAQFQKYYKLEPAPGHLTANAAYGLTEWNRDAIHAARLVACPGCFPTGALLALTPLARAGLLDGPVVVDSKTGSSGSGKEPGEGTHHPTRAGDFRAYGQFTHRHTPEIAQELSKWRQSPACPLRVTFTPHSAPMVRGIFTTAYAFPSRPVSAEELEALYTDAYADEPFVRLVDSPRVGVVAHSNFCDIHPATDGAGTIVVTSAIDNLVKGGAGQAVQNLNVAFGWPERIGLSFPGTQP
ncbi:MAG TPA: N-acetyl-gamma-glutamyl-phosphate reductase, partial [Chloroflexia bacterium]|nr:N-acetyl-gamma-glutamyl-phosphate reductase [Chloroflexia bacterium]